MSLNNQDPRAFQLDQIAAAAEEFESDLVRAGSVPDLEKLPIRRLRGPLEWIGGVLLAAIISFFAIWAVHFALNNYLHYGAG